MGEMTQYVLRENRELYSVDMEVDSLVSIGRVRKSTCRDMFERLDLLHDEEINAPGNRWYFVELKNGSDSTRLLWGDQAVDVPTGLIELWDDLMELTQPK